MANRPLPALPSQTVSASPATPPRSTGPQSGGRGLRVPSNKRTIYDRNLNKTRNAELSRAAFAFLFGEMIAYAQRRVQGVADLEKRLNEQGYPLGLKLLDLLLHRSTTSSSSSSSAALTQAPTTRPTRILPLLQFISGTLWRHLFGRGADALERSTGNANEYMITDNEPLVNTFISVPKEMSQLNCAAFVAGIIEGVCDGSGLSVEGVSVHSVGDSEESGGAGGAGGAKEANMWPGKTIFLIKFKSEVVEREESMGKGG